MAPKKVADETIENALAEAVRHIFHNDEKDALTVNYARQVAEKKLKLQEGFLKEGNWKARSKRIVHDTLVCNSMESIFSWPSKSFRLTGIA